MLEFQKFHDSEPTVLESPTFSGLLILSETFRKKMFIGYPDFHFEIPKIHDSEPSTFLGHLSETSRKCFL